jgi:hypothetical protein
MERNPSYAHMEVRSRKLVPDIDRMSQHSAYHKDDPLGRASGMAESKSQRRDVGHPDDTTDSFIS